MTAAQQAVLTVMGDRVCVVRQLTHRTGYPTQVVTHILWASYRRCWVTFDDGRWQRTARGARALNRQQQREVAAGCGS